MIASQAGATLNNLLSHAQELVGKLRSLQLDQREFVCLKFLVLFSLGESHILYLDGKNRKCSANFMLRTQCKNVNVEFISPTFAMLLLVEAQMAWKLWNWRI